MPDDTSMPAALVRPPRDFGRARLPSWLRVDPKVTDAGDKSDATVRLAGAALQHVVARAVRLYCTQEGYSIKEWASLNTLDYRRVSEWITGAKQARAGNLARLIASTDGSTLPTGEHLARQLHNPQTYRDD